MVRQTPRKVIDDTFQIPKALYKKGKKIILHMDVFFMNEIGFLSSIGHPIYYRDCVVLGKRDKQHLYAGLDKTLRVYNSNGFRVSHIYCDTDFKVLMDEVKDNLDVTMNYTNSKDHESVAERNNRTIKESYRTGLHCTPYSRIPKVMIEELMVHSTKRINWFPAKHSIYDTYSPMTILEGQTLDYKKDCTYKFGTYVQAHTQNNPTNPMMEHRIDSIYLRPNENQQGGHIIMNLNTGKRITKNKVTAIPLLATVKNKVEEMAL